MKTALGTILITEEEIRSRISELGRAISKDYAGGTVTLVGILRIRNTTLLFDLRNLLKNTRFPYIM